MKKRILIVSIHGNRSGVPLYTKTIIDSLKHEYSFTLLTSNSSDVFENLVYDKDVKIILSDFDNNYGLINIFKAYCFLKKIYATGEYHIIHLQGSLLSTIGRILKKPAKSRILVFYHGIPFDSGVSCLKRYVFMLLEFILRNNKDHEFVALTKNNKDSLIKLGYKNIIIIENYSRLDAPLFVCNSPEKKFKILAIGGNRPQKNYKYLFELFNNLPINYELTILGDGTSDDCFIGLAGSILSKSKLERIKFVGSVTDISEYLSTHGVYIQTSLYEGFSLAALEARSFGLKLALSNTSGSEEIVRGYSSSVILTFKLNDDIKLVTQLSNSEFTDNDISTRSKYSINNFLLKLNALYNNEPFT